MRSIAGTSLALALLLAACGSSSPTKPAHQLRVDSNGSNLEVRVGERIDLTLPPAGGQTWNVYAYPQDALHLDSSEPSTGRFIFAVIGPGDGRVVAYLGSVCGPPVVGPSPGASCDPEGDPIDPIGGHLPGPRVFSVNIHVALES